MGFRRRARNAHENFHFGTDKGVAGCYIISLMVRRVFGCLIPCRKLLSHARAEVILG